MTDRPIIFSAPMVRALIDGRKTQTRRVLKLDPAPVEYDGMWMWKSGIRWGAVSNPTYPPLPYATGDRLWVREVCATWALSDYRSAVYRADETDTEWDNVKHDARTGAWKLRSPIHMPRWASRLTLTVTDVRVQRLQEISEADAKAEGVEHDAESQGWWGCAANGVGGATPRFSTAELAFRDLWNSIHGPDAWDANPWVAAVTFTVERRNIDEARP
jgi:hypothetical protein